MCSYKNGTPRDTAKARWRGYSPLPMFKQLPLWDWLEPLSRIFSPPAPPAPPQRIAPDAIRPSKPALRPAPPVPPTPLAVPAPRQPRKRPAAARAPKSRAASAPDPDSAQARYDAVVQAMLTQYGIRVRKWRKSMSGVAWMVEYTDGRLVRLIEAPKPKGPMSAAIFLHEIGHHAIGFNVYKPRCLEEFHAWRWSLEAMQQQNLNITDQVRYRMHLSLWYAVSKAKRRGIRSIPAELVPFMERPVKPTSTADTANSD